MNDRPRSRRAAPRSELPAGGLTLELRLQSRRWRDLGDIRPRIEAAIGAGLAEARLQPLEGAELSLLLTDDKRIRAVNREWRGFDKPTNVLSFPAVPPERVASSPVLGDIVLALETLTREAEAEGKNLGDHLSHLVIHGLLHLLGEDHETEAEAQRMEAMETAALARLGIADPYAGTDLHPTEPAPAAAPRKKQSSPAP